MATETLPNYQHPTAPLAPPAEQAPALPEQPKPREMEGWMSDIQLTGNRPPLLEETDVEARHGHAYGKLMGEVWLPSKSRIAENPNTGEPMMANDATKGHTLFVFDGRKPGQTAPRYLVATKGALEDIQKRPAWLRGLYTKVHPGVQTVTPDKPLKVGRAANRWLPREVRNHELASHKKGEGYSVSREQTEFRVGPDNELYVESQGSRNKDLLLAHASPGERQMSHDEAQMRKTADKERAARREQGAALEAARVAIAHTQPLRPAAETSTVYLSRHAAHQANPTRIIRYVDSQQTAAVRVNPPDGPALN